MSLPPELRVVCHTLSTTAPTQLPSRLPVLLRLVVRCQALLGTNVQGGTKKDAAGSSVLVHKLKIQLTTLLNGKSSEGTFAAAVLIKAVVEVGGWEMLRDSEQWVRGLLNVLSRSEVDSVQEISILTLTKMYCMTHPYQTLLREITTPTLPGFVTCCLNLVSSMSPTASPTPLLEVVLTCIATLLPRHTTVFRPFAAQIQRAVKPLLAPTQSDSRFVSSSVKCRARRLAVLLHCTAPKNAGAEDWGKAMHLLVTHVHMTADQVFRAIIEDWESSVGYVNGAGAINQQVSGGEGNAMGLPQWSGIASGIERLTGLLEVLQEYLQVETPFTVSIPLGNIFDLITRVLSLRMPSPSSLTKAERERLHPAVDQEERDGLWCGLPYIYVAVLRLVDVLIQRLDTSFIPMAQGSLDLVAWVFASGRHDPDFRSVIYQVGGRLLLLCGPSLEKTRCSALFPLIRAACHDAQRTEVSSHRDTAEATALDAGNISQTTTEGPMLAWLDQLPAKDGLYEAASSLLALFMSHMPQEHVDISIRSLMERTAILSRNKEAMLASILHPYLGRGFKAMPSILPHFTRAFPDDAVTEILIRPRMPLVPTELSQKFPSTIDGRQDDSDEVGANISSMPTRSLSPPTEVTNNSIPGIPTSTAGLGITSSQSRDDISQPLDIRVPAPFRTAVDPDTEATTPITQATSISAHDVNMIREASDSDEESVHLTMELDSDSDYD